MPVVDMYGQAYAYAFEDSYFDVTHEDYLGAMQDLLPYGPAWTRRQGATLTKLLQGLAREPSRVEARASQLIDEADPRSTQELLEDWEAFVGLPDCGALAPTVEGRQAAVHAKLTRHVSPTPDAFKAIAEALGYTGVVVTRTVGTPFTPGSVVGDSLYGGPWHHTFSITTNESTDNDAVLECLVNQLVPSHATVILYLGP